MKKKFDGIKTTETGMFLIRSILNSFNFGKLFRKHIKLGNVNEGTHQAYSNFGLLLDKMLLAYLIAHEYKTIILQDKKVQFIFLLKACFCS